MKTLRLFLNGPDPVAEEGWVIISDAGSISAADGSHLGALASPLSIPIDGEATLAVAAFPHFPTLKLLYIAANLVEPEDLPVLASRCPNLQTFIVKHPGTATKPPQITDQSLTATLPVWTRLERITLNRIPFTAWTAEAIGTREPLEGLTLELCGPLTVSAFTPPANLE